MVLFRKIRLLYFTLFFTVTMLISTCLPIYNTAQTVYAKSSLPRLHISGSKIYDSNNKQIVLRGFSSADGALSDSWDKWYNSESLSTIHSWGANVFRITADIYKAHDLGTEYYKEYSKYLDECINSNIYAIVCWMGNSDFSARTNDAISFFSYISEKYGDSPYLLYEILNEPFDSSWNEIQQYSNKIIPVIRKKAPNSIIIIPSGLGFWKNSTNKDIINSPINSKNIIYQQHIYVGDTLSTTYLDETSNIINSGYPVMFTEWGATDANGKDNFYSDYAYTFLKYCNNNNISWCNFNLSDFTPKKDQVYQSSVCLPGKWDNSLNNSCLSNSGLLIKNYLQSGKINLSSSVMMNYTEDYGFWDKSIRSTITNIHFINDGKFNHNYDKSWDMSMCRNTGDVIAYLSGTDLYIVAKKGKVLSPSRNDYYFNSFSSLKSFSFNNFDTHYCKYTNAMFSRCTSMESIDLSQYNTTMLTSLSSMFYNCENLKKVDFSKCNLTNVTNYENCFYNCFALESIILPDINSSIIEKKDRAFRHAGEKASNTNIVFSDSQDKAIFSDSLH